MVQRNMKKSLFITIVKVIPTNPRATKAGSILNKESIASNIGLLALFACHNTPHSGSNHLSKSPIDAAYAGQSNGIMITGANHIPRVLILFLLLVLVDVNIRYATSGIIVNAGILVNMANPRNIPD